jgi:flagellin FlaB
MGIDTLIIFIAGILVAAVAAAVLISTSNVLQQRSLLVGQEARKAITDAIEVVSILAASDSTTETFNNYEILVRLSPGSDPLQMRKFNLQYISLTYDQAAVLLYKDNETTVQLGAINATANTSVYDIDFDGTTDTARLVLNAFDTSEGIQFWLSDYDVWTDTINLGVDLAAATAVNVTVRLDETAITIDEDYYGYVSISGQSDLNNALVAGMNVTVSEMPASCEFDLLPPDIYYCYKIMNGNTDYVLASGERFKLLYKVDSANAVSIGEDFMFIFTTEKGRLSEARARTPDVVVSTKTKLWPLG